MNTPLEIKLEGNRELNNHIAKCIKSLMPELKKIQGQKIFKVDGSLMKSMEHLKNHIPTLKRPDGSSYSIGYFEASHRSFKLTLKICKSGGSYDVTPSTAYCEYFEKTIYLAHIENQILTNVDTYEKLHQSWNLDEPKINLKAEKKKMDKFNEKKKELDKLLSDIDSTVRNHYNLNLR